MRALAILLLDTTGLYDRADSESLAPVFVWSGIAGPVIWALAIWKILDITGLA